MGGTGTLSARTAVVLYVGSGVLQPLLVDSLKYAGFLGGKALMLPMLANVAGMILAGLYMSWGEAVSPTPALTLSSAIIVACNFSAAVFSNLGLATVGGGVFVILYSSTLVWNALIASARGKRRPIGQWVGVLTVFLGLCLNCIGSDLGLAEGGYLGAALVLTGAIVHSVEMTVTDVMLSSAGGYDPRRLCLNLGVIEFVSLLCWNAGLTTLAALNPSPRGFLASLLSSAVYSPPSENWLWAVGTGLLLLAANAIHAAGYFYMVGAVGAVGSSMAKAAQTGAVYLTSAVLFCQHQQLQCITPAKGASVIVVFVGTILYGVLSPSQPPAKSKSD